MTTEQNTRYNLTTPAILAFPTLFEAKAVGAKGKATGTPKFSANFILDPAVAEQKIDIDGLKAVAIAVARSRWPGRDLKELKFPFSSGDKAADKRKAKNNGKDDGAFQRGKVILVARSKYEPRLAVIRAGKIVDLEGPARASAKNEFYAGCHVLAQVNFASYDGAGENPDGVCAYLDIIVSLNKGEKLAGGAVASEVFKGYVGAASVEDPTAGGDAGIEDDISF